MPTDDRGSVTIEGAIVLPVLAIVFVVVALGIHALSVRVALTKLVSDCVNCISAEATVYNLRPANMGDLAIANDVIDRCLEGNSLNRAQIEVVSLTIPYAGQAQNVELCLEYQMGAGSLFSRLVPNPRIRLSQKPWIDPRVSLDDLKESLLSYVYDWARSRDSGGDKLDDDSVVYVTKTGQRYHKSWCNCLRHSCNQMSFAEAVNYGYTPCEFCVLMTAELIGYPLER